MAKAAIWVVLAAAIVALLWHLGGEKNQLSALAAGILASALSLVLGVGVGDAARRTYVRRVVEMNRQLAEQNDQLKAANGDLLSRLSAAQLQSTDKPA